MEYVFREMLASKGSAEDTNIAIHVVTVDPNARGGRYLQISTIAGFVHRLIEHHQRWEGNKFLGYRNLETPFYFMMANGPDAINQYQKHPDWLLYSSIPVVPHANVWDFFAHIKYDYKNRMLKGIRLQRNTRKEMKATVGPPTQKQIASQRKRLDSRITELRNKINDLQVLCTHPNATKKHKADTGNWCAADDSYWTEFNCPDCGKFWTVEGSV